MNAQMKASVYTEYGAPEVLRVRDVEKPVPGDNEVLIKIEAVVVSAAASHFRQGVPFSARLYAGLWKPGNGILGAEFAGEIEAVGQTVTLFKPGDRIFGITNGGMGAHAEYICLPQDAVIEHMPEGLTFEEAAGIPEALTAVYFLKDLAKTHPGQKILINGAAGAIGSYAVQLARYVGAEVTGVCSTANVERVKALGANHVIDYTHQDFTRQTAAYDVIFDVVGLSSFAECKNALRQGGVYLTTLMTLTIIRQMLWTSKVGSKKAMLGLGGLNLRKTDLSFLKMLVESGDLKTVIDRCYPLEDIVEAHRYVDTGHKKGTVVISMPALN